MVMMVLHWLRYGQRARVISCTQFNLQSAVMNGVTFSKRHFNFIQEGVARGAVGHDQVNCQRTFGGTQAPYMQIMNVCYTL